MLTLTIVRHGATAMNEAGMVQSYTDGELTPKGVLMAEALGKYFAKEKFSHVFTSDLNRCKETATYVTKNLEHAAPDPIVTVTIRERDYGDWEHMPASDAVAICKEQKLPYHKVRCTTGETYEQVLERCATFFKEISALADSVDNAEGSSNVLAVTHAAWILCFMDHLKENENLRLEDFDPELVKQPIMNTSFSRIHIESIKDTDPTAKRLVKFDVIYSVDHLKASEHFQGGLGTTVDNLVKDLNK